MLTIKRILGDEEVELPGKWVICLTCEGNGRVLTASMRSVTYTAEDMAADPEFFKKMKAGHYDVICEKCLGAGKVVVVDGAKLDEATLKRVVSADLYEKICEKGWGEEYLQQARMMGEK